MGDEFTILVYKSERQLKTREKILVEEMEKRMGLDPTDYEKMFTETALDIQENGMDFHAPEIICDESTKIGYKDAIESVVAKQMRNLTHGTILKDNEDSISDGDNNNNGQSDYEEIKKDLKRKVTQELEEGGVSSKKKYRGVKNFGTVAMKATSCSKPKDPRFREREPHRFETTRKFLLGETPEEHAARRQKASRAGTDAYRKRGDHVKDLRTRLAVYNEAYDNVRKEKLDRFDVHEEDKVAETNAIVSTALEQGITNHGAQMTLKELSKRGKRKSIRVSVPYPEECEFCHKLYPHKAMYLHPHMRQFHPKEWPAYWNKNKPKSKRVQVLENTKEFDGLWKYNENHFDPKFGNRSQFYDCLVCGHHAKSATQMHDHLNKNHVRIDNFICEYCGDSLSCASTLKTHIIYKHTQDFPYRCKFCGKGAVTYHNVWVI